MKPLFLIRGIDWTVSSAGVNLIHTLAERLYEEGEDVCMSPCKMKPGTKVEIFSKAILPEGKKIVLVEPEIASGEQPWADLVVRWLLNVPGKTGKDNTSTWGKDDAIFHLCREFAYKDSLPLSFGMIDHSIFNNVDNWHHFDRKLNCFFARKARYYSKNEYLCPEGWLDLSNTHYSHKELASIFRKTKVFRTMDLTCCSVEALLCGAKHEFLTSDYLPEPPVTDYLAWHDEMESKSDERLENFLDICYGRVDLKREALVHA